MRNPFQFIVKRDSLLIRIAAVVLLLVCAVTLLSQTVFAQTTYVITDGDRVLVHTTYATDPVEVLDEAGLELGQDDTYVTQAGTGISEITVKRSQTVYIDHNGKQLRADTYGETVESLLTRLNIPTEGNSQVSVALDTFTYDGMELAVGRTTRSVETYTVPMAFETVYQEDPTLPAGTEVVVTEGVDGQKQCMATMVYRNGVEESRMILREDVIVEPVDQVVAVGTAVEEAEETVTPVFGKTPISIGDGTITTADGDVLFYHDTIQVLATAYHKSDEGCDDYTATGTLARVGAIAVDPDIIPYGTRMFIVSDDGMYIYGIATAEDCGGSIQNYRVDLYFDSVWECNQFGRRDCTIYILG